MAHQRRTRNLLIRRFPRRSILPKRRLSTIFEEVESEEAESRCHESQEKAFEEAGDDGKQNKVLVMGSKPNTPVDAQGRVRQIEWYDDGQQNKVLVMGSKSDTPADEQGPVRQIEWYGNALLGLIMRYGLDAVILIFILVIIIY